MILSVYDILLTPVYLLVIFLFARRIRNKNIVTNPVYKYYIPGLFAKIAGGIGVCLIYTLYYGGGDTVAFFQGSTALVNLLFKEPTGYFSIMVGNLSVENLSLFDISTGWPSIYMWNDHNTFFVIRFVSLITLFAFKNFIPATILLAGISYFGIWRLFKLFCEQFPQLSKHFAISILYMPSVVFWGSGMLKDTITFSAVCWFTCAIYYLVIKRERMLFYLLCLFISSYLLISIKPYIFIALMPGALVWVSHERIQRIKSVFLQVVSIPLILVISGSLVMFVFSQVGAELGKYSSVEGVLQKAVLTQQDLTRVHLYGAHSYNVGDFDASVGSMISKAPIAIIAALYRPFLWEAGNIVMLISALENTFILGLSILLLFKVGIFKIIKYITSTPILFFSICFALFFAFAVGISTGNFGALVRYKIPAIPFFLSSLFILYNYYKLSGRKNVREVARGRA